MANRVLPPKPKGPSPQKQQFNRKVPKVNKQKLASMGLIVFLLASFAVLFAPNVAAQTVYHSVTFAETTGGSILVRVNPLTKIGAGTYELEDGQPITIYTLPDTGYIFTYFSFEGVTSGNTSINPLYTTVLSNFTITAHFTEISETWYTTEFHSSVGGQIWVYYSGIQISDGTYTMPEGAFISVRPMPDLGYSFNRFEIIGDLASGATVINPLEINVLSNFSITAYFDLNQTSSALIGLDAQVITDTGYISTGGNISFTYQLSMSANPTGPYYGGTYYPLYVGSIVEFRAIPDPGYSFLYYTVNGTVRNEAVLRLTLTVNTEVYAVFKDDGSTDWLDGMTGFQATIYNIVLLLIASLAGFGCIVIFMRVPAAWLIGLILLLASFFMFILVLPNLLGLVSFSITIIVSTVFLFGSGHGGNKNK